MRFNSENVVGLSPVECHAIHASCTIKGLVTNYTVIFADYAKFHINQVKRALKVSYDCLL